MRTVLFISSDENHSRKYTAGLRARHIGLVPTGAVDQAAGLLHHFTVDAVVHHLAADTPEAWQEVGAVVTLAGRTPVLLLTRVPSPDTQQRALRMGCAGYADEPCAPSELAALLRKLP
jgi:DNA-binding NtrC family response regulator